MTLLMSGEPIEIREVSLRNKPAALIEASSKATVPVLVLPDGEVIDESLDIMLWALNRNDPEGWLAGSDIAMVASNDGPFKHDLDRYKYPERHASDPVAHRTAGLAMLGEYETRLAETANLCRDTRSFADIAIMPFVRQFAATDRAWFDEQTLPLLKRWLALHVGSPLFERAMARLGPWTPGDAPIHMTFE